jgi:hypothetical protein
MCGSEGMFEAVSKAKPGKFLNDVDFCMQRHYWLGKRVSPVFSHTGYGIYPVWLPTHGAGRGQDLHSGVLRLLCTRLMTDLVGLALGNSDTGE